MEQQQSMEEMLSRFNPEQRKAVLGTQGPMLIIAGAGSGKTSVLTARIALLLSHGALPENILALTFTKKAAGEMRDRVIASQGDKARRLTMGTFHSVFVRFLRPYANRLGFPENFTILDEDDSLSCLKKCISDVVSPGRPPKEEWTREQERLYEEQDRNYKAKIIAEIISRCKNELITAEAYNASEEIAGRDRAARRPLTGRIFTEYRNACFRMGMMDFDDILLYTDILLANCPDVLAAIAGQYRYILVDEFQDTNYAQYSILRRLTQNNSNICVVGDDSQSIYAFRGARIQNILNFQKDYQGCQVVKLEQNYRSTRNIVNAANNIISRNEERIPKVCFTQAEQGDAIQIKTLEDERDEARYIAGEIRAAILSDPARPYSDFAVLYRTNAQSRAIEDALVKSRVPYTVYSGTTFFSRTEVKDLLAYFRLAVNPNDDESFERVANRPKRGLGKAAIERLRLLAKSWNVSLWQAATNPQFAYCGFTPKVVAGIQDFVQTIQAAMILAHSRTAHDAALEIERMTHFYEDYASQKDEDSQKRADNIRELVDAVKSYEEDLLSDTEDLPETPTLMGFLQNVMLLSNADTGKAGDKVSLMTVHCAKGLEFDTVFIAGMEKNLFPLEIDGTQFEEEEERRLFYVAVTRAKRTLIITKANQRLRFGKRAFTSPSAFLTELHPKKIRKA